MHDLLLVELLDVEYYYDLEMWVRGDSKSLKIARIDRPCMTFYRLATVTTALSCTIIELFDVE